MINKQLILLRHATASPQDKTPENPSGTDFERPLSARGIMEAQKLGRWMADHIEQPELIISSSAKRARQTTEQVCAQCGWSADLITLTRSIYSADSPTIHKITTTYLEDRSRLMIVGHNPGLEQVLRELDPNIKPEQGQPLMGVASIALIALTRPADMSSRFEAKTERLLQINQLDQTG